MIPLHLDYKRIALQYQLRYPEAKLNRVGDAPRHEEFSNCLTAWASPRASCGPATRGAMPTRLNEEHRCFSESKFFPANQSPPPF
ncbi:hypothetical protein LF1_46910 [Rubripirellula obstinata]|uniref:Uncharacterized protein n=1 Tax=Rubripirellula obstinata TaxID=406547 RepID=A0A5B1CR59_9BACT|nr:hypothetical protein LF1_46910 [Rubripirellula obstinata]